MDIKVIADAPPSLEELSLVVLVEPMELCLLFMS